MEFVRKRLSRSHFLSDQSRQSRGFSTIIHYIPLCIGSGAVFLRPLSKTSHYGILHLYRLSYRIDCPHQDSCAVVGLASLYRQRFGVARDLGFARWRGQRKYHQQTKSRTRMKNRVRNVWQQFKELFQRKDAKDMAIFHCSDCGNDFKARRYITREDYDDENLTVTLIYFPSKCPKCGNWATTQKTIQTFHVPCTEE